MEVAGTVEAQVAQVVEATEDGQGRLVQPGQQTLEAVEAAIPITAALG